MGDSVLQGAVTFGLVIVAIIGISLGAALANWLAERLRAKLGNEQFELLNRLARQAVLAAEQSGLAQGLAKAGVEKKHQAMASIQAELDRRGIKMNAEAVADAVEAACWTEINRYRGGGNAA